VLARKTDPSHHRRFDPQLGIFGSIAAQKVDLASVQRVLFSFHHERSPFVQVLLPHVVVTTLYQMPKYAQQSQTTISALCVSNSPGISFLPTLTLPTSWPIWLG
jgi:hypothetical protein